MKVRKYKEGIYILGIWLLSQQVFRAGITNISGIVNITDIADDTDIATDIIDGVNIADIADRILRILR